MQEDIIQKYKNEMLKMYRSAKKPEKEVKAVPVVSETAPVSEGNLLVTVTTIRTLYPVPAAKVTVFTGDYNDMNVIDTAFTDQSGRTRVFTLPTPEKALSLDSGNKLIPYANYNLLIQADGYVDNVHINVPVFSGVTSVQNSNLMLKETAGENMNVQIFDESEKYDL